MKKGEMTRQRIIELAAPLFNQRGFEGCSVQDIMEATGLKKGGLYRHFVSKEELAAEAFRYALGQAMEARITAPGPTHGAVERLADMIDQFVEKPSPVPGGCPILNTAIDTDDGNPVLRKLARDGLRAWRDRIMAISLEGVRQGEVRADIEPRALANTIIATLEGALMISRLEGSRTALSDARQWLRGMIAQVAVPSNK